MSHDSEEIEQLAVRHFRNCHLNSILILAEATHKRTGGAQKTYGQTRCQRRRYEPEMGGVPVGDNHDDPLVSGVAVIRENREEDGTSVVNSPSPW